MFFNFREFVSSFKDNEAALWEMAEDFERFEEGLPVDDSLLVRNAQIISRYVNGGDGNKDLVFLINRLALHIYRHLAIKHKQ